jgi:hypothetical protein
MNFSGQEQSDENERALIAAISALLGGNQRLLDYLFDASRTRLRKRAGILKEDSWRFSASEPLLIRAALDFWSGSGHVQLWEMLEEWDEEHWRNFIRGIGIRIDLNTAGEG